LHAIPRHIQQWICLIYVRNPRAAGRSLTGLAKVVTERFLFAGHTSELCPLPRLRPAPSPHPTLRPPLRRRRPRMLNGDTCCCQVTTTVYASPFWTTIPSLH